MNATPAVASGFHWHDSAIGPVLRCDALQTLVEHAFTTRAMAFRDASVEGDYGRLGEVLARPAERIARLRQVHGRTVLVVRSGDRVPEDAEADAVVSLTSECGVSVRTADCVPVLLADRGRRVVAAVHAGWRGTCVGVTAETVEAIERAGVPASDLVAALGPAIGACCYQVDDRVRTAFLGVTPDAASWFHEDGPRRWKLDLLAANTEQLVDAGLQPEAVHVAQLCTADHPEACYSHRREGPGAGRLVAAACLRA